MTSERTTEITGPLIYPEHVLLGESFVENLRALHAQLKQIRSFGLDMPTSPLTFGNFGGNNPDLLFIPSKPVEIRRTKDHKRIDAEPLERPVFLSTLFTNLTRKDAKELVLTGHKYSYDQPIGPHDDYFDFDPAEHTLAILPQIWTTTRKVPVVD
jgi:hypothetical protein